MTRLDTGTSPAGGRSTVTLRRLRGALRVALGLGLLAWVLTRGDVLSSARLLQGSWALLLVALLPIGAAAIEAKRLAMLFEVLGIALPFADGYRIVAISSFFNFAVPGGTGGDVAKMYYLVTANRDRRVAAATGVVMDRVVAFFSWLLVTLLLGAINHQLVLAHRPLWAMLLMAALGALALLALAVAATSVAARGSRPLRWIVERAPLHRLWSRVADALYAYRHRRGVWVAATLWSLLGHLTLLLMFLAIARVLLPAAEGLDVALLSFIGMLANALPITPGGLGVGEVAFDRLFRMVGLGGGAQLLLAWRVAMLPLGILGALLYVRGKKAAGRARAAAG